MPLNADCSYPTSIRFGAGRLAEIASACRASGIARPLLVTDEGLARLAITDTAYQRLSEAGLAPALFTDVEPNPTEANLRSGLDAYRAGDHDGIVAFGGGSALDLGKLIAFMSAQTRSVWDFEDIGDWWTRAKPEGIAPIVAVPTTAGTGSEVGRAAVLTDPASGRKKIIFHPKMLPGQVIVDAELTLGLPPAITAGTGMDAFAHCLEAFCSPHYHPMSQGIALEGMRLVNQYLERAFEDGTDIEARAHMMSAATMGAVAFQKGLGAIHALSHPVGALYGTHHGTTNAVVMPYVLEFNRSHVEERLNSAADYIGVAGGYSGFFNLVRELNARLGIPETLRDLGVGDDRLEDLVAMALADPTVGGNPREMTPETTRALFRACLGA